MKVILALNELYRDGMGSAAITLYRALVAQGLRVVPVHAWRDVKFPEYLREANPIFVNNDGYGFSGDKIKNMVEAINGISDNGDALINFGSANWLACVPYLNPELRVITAVHSINPSTLKVCAAYAERVSAWICISRGVMDRFLKKLPRKYHRKVHLVCNAVDVCPKPKTDWGIGTPLRILYVGRIEDTSKGCGKIPKIVAELKRRGLSVNCDFYGYFHNWEEQFWQAVDRAGVCDEVKYCGEVRHEEIYSIMPRYDIFIAPSNFEGFPISISEAMSCALPVVMSQILGVTDWISENGKCAICVDKTDIRGFATAIKALADDEALRARLGTAARERISELASFEAHGMGYANVLKRAGNTREFSSVRPHCPVEAYVQPEILKPWGPARLLPVWLKSWLRRFM